MRRGRNDTTGDSFATVGDTATWLAGQTKTQGSVLSADRAVVYVDCHGGMRIGNETT